MPLNPKQKELLEKVDLSEGAFEPAELVGSAEDFDIEDLSEDEWIYEFQGRKWYLHDDHLERFYVCEEVLHKFLDESLIAEHEPLEVGDGEFCIELFQPVVIGEPSISNCPLAFYGISEKLLAFLSK